ncbi:hypothetical protein HYALB_00010341 [Hymenoscyphus albidus]|uniref:Uncharacterized protein n=1 Tax=Hymenoscyphus albidus TaxID=595503 RepID=A0A9N9LL05_9HELO|nr:hypothetical protein HYALB_00010341 [Hymenoscyphus albidus]
MQLINLFNHKSKPPKKAKKSTNNPRTDYFGDWEAHVTHHLTTTHPKRYSKVTIPPPPTPTFERKTHRTSVLPVEIVEEDEEDEGKEQVCYFETKEKVEKRDRLDRRGRTRTSRVMNEKRDLCKVETVCCDGDITPGCGLRRMETEITRVNGRPKLPRAQRYVGAYGRAAMQSLEKFENERGVLKWNGNDKRWSMRAVDEEDGMKSFEYRTPYSRYSMVVPSVSRLAEDPSRRSAPNSPRNSVHGLSRRLHSQSPSRHSLRDFSGRSVHSQSPRNSYHSPSRSSLRSSSRHSVHSPSRLPTQGLSRGSVQQSSTRHSVHGPSKMSSQYVPGYAIQTAYRDSIQVLTEQQLAAARLATAGMSNSTRSSFELPRRGEHIEYVSAS